MIATLRRRIGQDSLAMRALRSSSWTVIGFGGSQAIRLVSNLVLTRLLMPEAFGLMALVNAFVIGLMQFSDMGTGPAILNSKRGDDPSFLDTAWTIQAMRGVALWVVSLVLTWPLALFYNEPQLAWVFPVAAFSLVINGLTPTRVDTAVRHLEVGRLTRLELLSQAAGIGATVVLALAMRNVWALAVGAIVGSVIQIAIMHVGLSGRTNRFHMERAALDELVGFGRWILLSTICGFLIFQGDRLVLGRYLSLDELGVYNIAYFLGTVPLMLGNAISGRLFVPVYRQSPPSDGPEAAARSGAILMRVALFLLGILAILALTGPQLVDVMYDPRYGQARILVVLIALSQIPGILTLGYEVLPLAFGASRTLFAVQATRAVLYIGLLLLGTHFWGVYGAIGAQALAGVLLYPVLARVARRYGAWSPRRDAMLAALALAIALLAAVKSWHLLG